ncbi:Arc family DNA-binding protein [Acinetobacter chinensis]|uniref:Arc family DNA-binding protein n=1 Tax=Acinetobacter chinensis TaxID=2004650 RepID=A0ABU3WER1_9GAMM|nr:Arc family DNA-binding protein [Acinetobacter chinensis]MDV2468901.1 Arc family DNA-binding protein [Acinetobacter chinensis]
MARTDPQINLRVPAELKKKLEILAIENSRSLNAEVVTRLENSIESGFDSARIPTEELMMELSNRFKGFSLVMMENKDIKKAP